MYTRRKDVQDKINQGFRPSNPNASLWFDKYIFNSAKDGKSEASTTDDAKKDETAKVELVRRVTSINEPPVYKPFFEHIWKQSLDSVGAKYRNAKVKNRLAINLGSESVLETNIALHRVFGVPFIAGSSLKGMTAAFIRQYGNWEKDKDFYITIFGDENNAGFITFYDALYVPESGFNERPLYADVITTHHQDYYGEKKEDDHIFPPADWDSPNPVPFISATGEYLVVLSAPEGCKDWIDLTFDILGFALATEGIGAKTSSGYGRLKLQDKDGNYGSKYELQILNQSNSAESNSTVISQNQPISENERIAKSFIERVNALRDTEVAGRIPGIAQECMAIENEAAKKLVAQAIKQKVIDAGREKATKGKKWFEDINSFT